MNDIALPLMIKTIVIERNGMTIYYPQIISHWDLNIANKINNELFTMSQNLIKRQYREQDAAHFDQMIGSFEVKTNERHVLSISFSNYAIAAFYAHGFTIMESMTFDVTTGKVYRLGELFKPSSDYVKRISKNIAKQIKERDIPVLEPFTEIKQDQHYYIADKALVIYFDMYELTPGYYGFPMFPISVYDLADIVTEDGPLGRMIGN